MYLKSIDRFKPKYTGPYIVVYKYSPVSVSIKRIHSPDDSAFRVISHDRMNVAVAPPRNDHLFVHHEENLKSQVNNSMKYNLRP